MTRREIAYLCVGLAAGAAQSTTLAQSPAPARRAPAGSVIFFAANDLHGMRNVGDTPASYFVLRWTSPGHDGPRPGGSR